MKRWVRLLLQRSAACLPRFILRSTAGGATAQPTRTPGARILLKVERYTTQPAPPSSSKSVGSASPSKRIIP